MTKSAKEYVLSLIQLLNWNYSMTIVNQTSTTITQKFTFTPGDVAEKTVGDKVILTLILA